MLVHATPFRRYGHKSGTFYLGIPAASWDVHSVRQEAGAALVVLCQAGLEAVFETGQRGGGTGVAGDGEDFLLRRRASAMPFYV